MLNITSSSGILLFALLLLLARQTDALRMINLDVPETALRGDTIHLSCFFSLEHPTTTSRQQPGQLLEQKSEFTNQRNKTSPCGTEVANKHQEAPGEQLYAIKWYKDEREFFRYLAQDWPRKQSFPMDGVLVDVDKSDNHTVVLKGVSLKTSGSFRCEVSTDAPSFLTKSMVHKMIVYSLPNQGPLIEPLKSNVMIKGSKSMKVHLDEPLEFVCTSPESKPAASFDWIINDSINLSASTPQADGSSLFQIREQRFVRLPSSSSTTSNRPQVNHISFRQPTRPISQTIYELHNGTMAVLVNENSASAPINLANALNQLMEISSSRLKFTVDSNLLQSISRTKSDAPIKEPQWNRVTRSQGNLAFNGQFVSVLSSSSQAKISQEVRLSELPIEASTQESPISSPSRLQLFLHSNGPEALTPSSSSGKRRIIPKQEASSAMTLNRDKFMIRLKCVARILHLSMSDEFRLRLTDKLKTRSDADLIATDARRRQTQVDASSGTAKHFRLSYQIYMIFVINTVLLARQHWRQSNSEFTLSS